MFRSIACVLRILAVIMLVPGVLAEAQRAAKQSTPVPVPAGARTNTPYADAKPILESLREDLLPADLRGKTPPELESAWPGWVVRRDAAIRARLERGDEDSLVNFLLFGTSFTKLPRATERDMHTRGSGDIVERRLADLVGGIASPGTNERLQFARAVIERGGIDPTPAAGKREVRLYLEALMERVIAETESYNRAIESAKLQNNPSAEFTFRSSLYRDRGLSSDTSILSGFAVDQALRDVAARKLLGSGSVRRVAIIGPGLDFNDRRRGYDFYPQQTIQPFALVDSLVRLGLAKAAALRIVTFDLSARVNQHLDAARQRARAGRPYVLQLPQDADSRWNPNLVTYWTRVGDQIGEETTGAAPPAGATGVQVRAVRVRPAVVSSIVPLDLNIVLQRLEGLADDDRFDLVVATNIFLYYDVFEQSLALVNTARMMRPGGFLLSNNALLELPGTPIESIDYSQVVYSSAADSGDDIIWYQRQKD